MKPLVKDFVKNSQLPILQFVEDLTPWDAVANIEFVIKSVIETLDADEYYIDNDQAVHKSATIEATAQLKGAVIVGPNCFVANGSLLRGGVILDADCIVGHCCEVKTSIMFMGSKVAHLSFAGDSILGCCANVEGGAILANYRNELDDKQIIVSYKGQRIATGVAKFGAILGDDVKVGANAVTAPGTLLAIASVVGRGELVESFGVPLVSK
ncbi:MAG: LpxA family transferase [Hyphomicrobiales bacterium]|nr:MAG: LpxA family transferase [Hyphomicrobiales bacterium]